MENQIIWNLIYQVVLAREKKVESKSILKLQGTSGGHLGKPKAGNILKI